MSLYMFNNMFSDISHKYFEGPMTHNQAQSACQGLGGSLVNIDSEEENILVGSLLPQSMGSWAWIGNKLGTEPRFFLSGRPNGNNANWCIRTYSLGMGNQEDRWDDQKCSAPGPYVCEYGKVAGTFIYIFNLRCWYVGIFCLQSIKPLLF